MEITFAAISSSTNIIRLVHAFIKNEVDELILDIADIHYRSARQSFIAALNEKKGSLHYKREVNNGIIHLQNAYNAHEKYFEKKKKKRVIGIFKKRIKASKRETLYENMSKIAIFISFAYVEIGANRKNAQIWKKNTLDSFDNFAKAYKKTAKGKSQVYSHSYTSLSRWGGNFGENRDVYKYSSIKHRELLKELDNTYEELIKTFKSKGI